MPTNHNMELAYQSGYQDGYYDGFQSWQGCNCDECLAQYRAGFQDALEALSEKENQ